jgi:putative heme-binding domain-containing protein
MLRASLIRQSSIVIRQLLLVCLLVTLSPSLLIAADDGESLYGVHCASCHGPKGEGGRGTTLAKAKLVRVNDDESLIALITQGIPGTEMAAARLTAPEIKQVAAWVRKLGQTSVSAPSRNASPGEQLYFGKGNCVQCHAIRANGGVLGPDLTDIGARRNREYLRRALLEPQAEVPDSFLQYRWYTIIPDNFLLVRVVTAKGEKITGARLNEDPFSIQIRDLEGRVRSFFKPDLVELHKDWGKSIMPSYRDVLSNEELNEMVTYLVSLRGDRGGGK